MADSVGFGLLGCALAAILFGVSTCTSTDAIERTKRAEIEARASVQKAEIAAKNEVEACRALIATAKASAQ